MKAPFENGEDAFTERRSLLFKHLHVTRFWDAAHQSFVYVVWTDRLVNGSPHNSISAVVAQSWDSHAPDLSQMKLAQKMKTSHHSQVDHFFGAILISFRALQTNFPVPISRPRIASKLP